MSSLEKWIIEVVPGEIGAGTTRVWKGEEDITNQIRSVSVSAARDAATSIIVEYISPTVLGEAG